MKIKEIMLHPTLKKDLLPFWLSGILWKCTDYFKVLGALNLVYSASAQTYQRMAVCWFCFHICNNQPQKSRWSQWTNFFPLIVFGILIVSYISYHKLISNKI